VANTGKAKSVRVIKKLTDKSNRIAASPQLDKLPDKGRVEFQEGQSVELSICDRTDIGYKAIINNSRDGLLYKNEVFQTLRKGQHIAGFIKKVRDDGKIDLCLQRPGAEKVDDVAETIVDKLKAQGGFIALNDKSPPEVIYSLFGASKKTYKKAIGALYKKRLILIEGAGIRLAKKNGIKNMTERNSNDPLHGITLEMILTRLVELHGWEKMGRMVRIRCFNNDPSIKSSLQFLRRTPWARKKVEALYLLSLYR